MTHSAQEQVLRERVITTLHSSLSLTDSLEAAREPLLELIPADAFAMCLMRVSPELSFQWLVPGPPIPLMAEYASLSDHDFVRPPIFAQPNVVFRDPEMLTRKEYDHNLLYQRSRELGLGLEHVMAVLLPIGPGFVCAVALYRTRRRAFSAQCANKLSRLTATLGDAVRNCTDFEAYTTGARLLEGLYNHPDRAFLIVEPHRHEVARSQYATTLLERWFARSDFASSGLPCVLEDHLAALVGMPPDLRHGRDTWVILHDDVYRLVRFLELPAAEGPRQWALLMHEIPTSIPLPMEMRRKLTPQQAKIAEYVLRNWQVGAIAGELHISEYTVETHMREIRNRLGVDSRADLIYQAARLNRPV
ncbi:helix-turn-helix transcriptional regulator [Myxococcaceae bacterium JPH2]|nr:helix-turn-helix transcriptional regulator [Myxococcaceae bacterium JPH2]